jgi:hypothetical protein
MAATPYSYTPTPSKATANTRQQAQWHRVATVLGRSKHIKVQGKVEKGFRGTRAGLSPERQGVLETLYDLMKQNTVSDWCGGKGCKADAGWLGQM